MIVSIYSRVEGEGLIPVSVYRRAEGRGRREGPT